MDLRDFFPSFSGARIQAFFRTAGYPEHVADLLGGICTNAVPRAVSSEWIHRRPHLPQGAPTSPALANGCFWRMDGRLAGLARSADAVYTRYADDLAFSGGEDFSRRVENFAVGAAAILADGGFSVNHRKTRVMRESVRQHLAGMQAARGGLHADRQGPAAVSQGYGQLRRVGTFHDRPLPYRRRLRRRFQRARERRAPGAGYDFSS